MEFITIFRVENEFGEGPYFNKDSHKNMHGWLKLWADGTHTDSKHPEPFDDVFLKEKMDEDGFFMDDYICGFSSREQVSKWFSEKELYNLSKLGYKLKSFEVFVDDVIVGKSQCLIKK
jgi:hypothetical protein